MLLAIMRDMLAAGSQILRRRIHRCWPHFPGAHLMHLDGGGITPVDYDTCDLVTSWRSFLQAPESFLRHLH